MRLQDLNNNVFINLRVFQLKVDSYIIIIVAQNRDIVVETSLN